MLIYGVYVYFYMVHKKSAANPAQTTPVPPYTSPHRKRMRYERRRALSSTEARLEIRVPLARQDKTRAHKILLQHHNSKQQIANSKQQIVVSYTRKILVGRRSRQRFYTHIRLFTLPVGQVLSFSKNQNIYLYVIPLFRYNLIPRSQSRLF